MDYKNEIKWFVENECKKPTSKYGYEPFVTHFKPMVEYAKILASELGADKEIVILAGWLHDIGSIVKGREEHHISGAEIAVQKLRQLGYEEEKIQKVKKCILNHRGSRNDERTSLEEKIIVDADVMSNFEDLPGLFQAAFVYEKLTRSEAKKKIREKLENKFKQLHFEKSRELVRPKYEAAMKILE